MHFFGLFGEQNTFYFVQMKKKVLPELHLLKLQFWTNLVSNISTKVKKITVPNAQLALFGANKVQI